MHTSWDDARFFLAVAETGSFSAAASTLQVTQPTVSRRIADLEFQLGLSLFHRGSQGTTVTAEAARLLPAARQMARWAAELDRAVAGQEEEPAGRVRITAPPGTAYDFLVPFCRWFKPRHPRIHLEVLANVDYLDLARGEAELAIRLTPPTRPGLVLLHALQTPVGVFAARDYVEGLPAGVTLADLDWVTWSHPMLHVSPRPELEALIPDFQPAFASDSYLVQHRACQLGLGAMFLPRLRHPFVPDYGLVEVDVAPPPWEGGFHLVCAASMEYVPRVRVVVEALVAQMDAAEVW